MRGEGGSAEPPLWKICVLRTGLVLVSSLVAVAVPNFAQFTDLVGNLLQPLMGFMIPPVFFLLIRQSQAHRGGDEGARKQIGRNGAAPAALPPLIGFDFASFVNVGVMVLGLASMVMGMRSTVHHLIAGSNSTGTSC